MSEQVHFSTTNGERSGRASHFYFTVESAKLTVDAQNLRAAELGIKSRYSVASELAEDLPVSEKPR